MIGTRQASRASRARWARGRLWRAAATTCLLLLLAGCTLVKSRTATAPSGTITVGLPGIGSLDPADATTPGALTILRAACDSLIGQDPSTGDLKPALAESWTIEPGGRGLVVRLNPNARYHDGSPVTPNGVAEQLSDIAQTGGASQAARELAGVLGHPGDQGAGSVRATYGGEVRIELPKAFAGLSVLLANPALAPVSAAASVSDKGGPNCAGPYRIERSRDGLRLVRDPDYHTGNAAFEGNGRGHVATIVIKEFESTDEAYDALAAGRVDAAPVPESRVAEAEVDPMRGAGHARRGTSEITYLAFDPSLVPTSNPVFRRAVSLALDRVALVDAAFGDRRPPATRWLVGAPDRPAPRSCDAGAQRVADRDRARKLLAANGIDAATFKLPLLFDPARTSPLVVQAIEAQLEDNLGLTVRPKPTDTPDFDAALAAARSVPKLWIATAPGGYGVPEQVLEALFRTGSPDNTNRFSDPRVDELIDRSRRADDAGERDRAYADAEGRVCELMPDVPLWTGVSHWAFDSKKVAFGGSSPIDAFGGLLLREARVR